MSANGQYQIALNGTNIVYYSSTFGMNWNSNYVSSTIPTLTFSYVAMSANGQFVNIVSSFGCLYNSTLGYASTVPYTNSLGIFNTITAGNTTITNLNTTNVNTSKLTVNNGGVISGDLSCNNRLKAGDSSFNSGTFNGSLFVNSGGVISGDLSCNNRLKAGDSSFNSGTFNGSLFVNSGGVISGDLSCNNRLKAGDSSFNSGTFNGSLFVNSGGVISGDLSCNNRLKAGDSSFNSGTFNGSLFVNGGINIGYTSAQSGQLGYVMAYSNTLQLVKTAGTYSGLLQTSNVPAGTWLIVYSGKIYTTSSTLAVTQMSIGISKTNATSYELNKADLLSSVTLSTSSSTLTYTLNSTYVYTLASTSTIYLNGFYVSASTTPTVNGDFSLNLIRIG
jgi:cytoskeletal protein CcmA (bactofilin family)